MYQPSDEVNILYLIDKPPNKSTMVLATPSTPSHSLNKTTTPSLSIGIISSKPTEHKEEDDEERDDEQEDEEGSEGDVSAEVVHFVLFGGAYISTYPTIFTILQILIVINL